MKRVAAGEQVEIARKGVTVAVIGPPRRQTFLPAADFDRLWQSLPRLDEETLRAIEAARAEVDVPRDPWNS
ncbi:MAG: hypothetical protein JO186_05075 [Actinobacteria bacterium]|nr:hypothetical protein [Actinomycetota bacterium]